MKIQPAFWHKIRQVGVITFIWVLANCLVELNNAVNYDPASRIHFMFFLFGNNGLEHLLITSVGPLLGGLLFGSFIVFYQRDKLKSRTYARKLLVHSLLYIGFLVVCIGIVGVIGALNNRAEGSFWQKLIADVFSLRVLRLFITWYFIVIFTIFLLDVSEKYGSGTLKKLLLGKYHAPGQEERIFMFLDLKSSTAIAERIGDERYFRMLRFFYEVANEAVINHYGEIYQYVGDEIVISWEQNQGLKNAHCLRCFTAIEEAVQQHASAFRSAFDTVPAFKAGVHTGKVATGEIGSVKKDIVYSGDVLNTTARIVALCNQYDTPLIISETLYQVLQDTPGYQFRYLGNPVLKGKKTAMALYATETTRV